MSIKNNIKLFSNSLGFKIMAIFILGLLLLVPMAFISSVVGDRKSYQAEAIESIIDPIGGTLTLDGILMVKPYRARQVSTNDDGKTSIYYSQEYRFIMPENYSVDGDIDMNTLSRGIFKVPVFSSELKIKGDFEKYETGNPTQNATYSGDTFIVVIMGNNKSFTKVPDIKVNGTSLEQYENTASFRIPSSKDMFVFVLPQEYARNGFEYNATFGVQGGSSVSIKPLKSQNTFILKSSWADPSFSGGWIPTKRDVTKDGFNAEWNIPDFHISLNKSWTTETHSYSEGYSEDFITTSFLLLNDNYQKTTRSMKYALLFIFIPFFALLLCELLGKKVLHIIQYALIGFANVLFFLLLLSISEHLSFNISYFIAAIMVATTVSLYAGYIIHSVKLGIIIAITQYFAYIFLFGILQLTDYSLLVGTLGLFFVVALAMYLTRNIDWSTPLSKE